MLSQTICACSLMAGAMTAAQGHSVSDVLVTKRLLPTGFNDANVGNGFLAFKVGEHCDDQQCSMTSTPRFERLGDRSGDSQKTLGGLHIAGLFNGLSNYTPSHRARLPSIHNVSLGGPSRFVQQALDVRRGVFTNTTRVGGATGCALTVEQRLFCHRTRRNVMVMELEALSGEAEANCSATVPLIHREEATAAGTVDVAFESFETDAAAAASAQAEAGITVAVLGATRLPELHGMAPTHVGLAYDAVPHTITLRNGDTRRFILAAHTEQEDIPASELVSRATNTLTAAKASKTLMAEHVGGWAEIWRSGIEIQGNVTVSRAVNASLYYLHSALRHDWCAAAFPLCSRPQLLAVSRCVVAGPTASAPVGLR